MSEVDTGTLGWVKAEIDGTIAEARACLNSDLARDDTPLRMLANHAHQLVGTLQMIDLSGPALFAAEAEALVEHLRSAQTDSTAIELLDGVFATLSEYLGALQEGAPDVPLPYLELLNKARAVRGAEALEPADLFTVDLAVYPPGRRAPENVPDSEFQKHVAELRQAYLDHLRQALDGKTASSGLAGCAEALDGLLDLAHLKRAAQLWWVARAYIGWLISEAGPLDPETEQILTEIDAQIREVGDDGEANLVREPPERLLKRILYRLATASTTEPRIVEVKRAFDLDRLLGGETSVASEVLSREALAALPREFGEALAATQQDMARYFEAEPTADNLQRLQADLGEMLAQAQAAEVDPLTGLIAETAAAVDALEKGVSMDREQASMDLAASLLFIDKTLNSERRLDADWADQLEARTNRLRILNVESPQAAAITREVGVDKHEFGEILQVVARELKAEVEQAKSTLEALAAHPDGSPPYGDALASVTRLGGMFQILARERVAELAGRVCRRLSALSEASGPAPAAVIDALAVALSAIESYLDDMPHPSVRTDARIEVAIEELTATEPSDSEIVTIFVDELEDHVSTLEQFVGRCRRRAADCRASDELRRALHTVAGSARAVNYSELADAYQAATLVLDGVAHRDGMLRATQLAILDDLAKLSRHALRDLKSKRAISPSLLASFAGLARSTDAVVETPLTAATHASQAEQADFLGIFLDEASDILARMEDGLREWRSGQGADEVLAGLRRELHTLKGSARAVGVETMGELSHSTETLLDRLGNNGIEYETTGLHALLEEVHDALVSAVAQLRTGQVPGPVPVLSAKLKRFPDAPGTTISEDAGRGSAPTGPAESDASTEMGIPLPRSQVRVSPALLDRLVNYAGEISITRARMQEQFKLLKHHLHDLRGHLGRFRDQLRELELHADDQIRVHREDREPTTQVKDFDPLEFDRYTKLQQLSRSLVESMDAMVTVNASMTRVAHDSESVLQEQGHLSSELHGSLLRARMVPFGTVVSRLRHELRHTAREVNKQAELLVFGDDVGIDRTILESMTEAFTHMIRNALDHGIETPEQRVAAGKPPIGRVRIECALRGSEVRLQFSDDGKGLDVEDIRARAVARGLINGQTILSDKELLQLIVAPGFSTVDAVTQLSGRGVGMDVVHSAVRRLGGTLGVHSKAHEGTTFSMQLPASLAMTQAVFVRCGNHTFAVSLRAVETISEVPRKSLIADDATGETLLELNDHHYPLMNLTQRFGLASISPAPDNVPVLLARMGATHVAVQVDELVGTQEIVVKKIGGHLAGLEGISGAAVRGDGRPVLVLDVVDLWVSEEAANAQRSVADDHESARPPLVMVVDDSLTVRKVTSRNLTRHGMRAVTAKDGVDALDRIKSHLPDIMLIDVEMPRMDGYELTERIRSHPASKAIPIIMVTSRAGEKHRDRALELGANAYITKPYHEDELVAEVRRLLDAPSPVTS